MFHASCSGLCQPRFSGQRPCDQEFELPVSSHNRWRWHTLQSPSLSRDLPRAVVPRYRWKLAVEHALVCNLLPCQRSTQDACKCFVRTPLSQNCVFPPGSRGSIALVCALQRQPVACGLLRPDGSPKALRTPRAPRSYMSDETDETGQTGETDEGRVVFDSQADACTARH